MSLIVSLLPSNFLNELSFYDSALFDRVEVSFEQMPNALQTDLLIKSIIFSANVFVLLISGRWKGGLKMQCEP